MNKIVVWIGRALFALPMMGFGVGHLTHGGEMAAMVPSFVPGGVMWVYFTGFCFIAGSLAILSGKQASTAALLMSLMLVIFATLVQLPGMANPDPMMKMMSTANFMKDIALAGAALVIAASFPGKLRKA